MFKRKFPSLLLGAAVIAGSIGFTAILQPAQADVIYTFDAFASSGTPPAGPYATVNLHQNGANVDLTVTLSAGEGFVKTGAGAALTWDLAGEPVVTIANLDTTNFVVTHNGTTTKNLDETGSWFYEIDCTTAGCGSGGSNPYPGPLTFTIDNITVGDFISNNETSTGYIFASDICTQRGAIHGCVGTTGDIAASASSTTYAREPGTLALLGTGILGIGLFRRRRSSGPRLQPLGDPSL